jgi:adenine deaminase
MDLAQIIRTALGQEPADLLLTNGKLVNVLSGDIHKASVAIRDGIVIGFGDYEATETIDLEKKYICPGLIDGHLHLESSMLAIPEFAANVVPQGTTAVVADPHEIANVFGLEGIRYILRTSQGGPLRVMLMFPSCVPATPFETSGATLGPQDMEAFLNEPRILGLAEMMNYPGVLFQDPDVLAKIKTFKRKVLDGHAPGLTGKELAAYTVAGIGSDHECTTLAEAKEKLRAGMRIMIREGSAAKNMDTLLPLVSDHNSANCFFVTDDLDPSDIIERGHIVALVRKAVKSGMDPVRAVQMASINTARYFRLRTLGAVAPGYAADIIVVNNLEEFKVSKVFHAGRLVAENGELVVPKSNPQEFALPKSFNVNWDKVNDLSVGYKNSKINVIEVIPGQIVTKHIVADPSISDSTIVADPSRDILKMAVIERHKGTGNFGVGFIKGFGLRKGAIAGSVAHDSHNIIVVGVADADMLTAAKEIAAMGGGMLVVADGKVLARLPLPIAGLMSDKGINEVCENLEEIDQAAKSLGSALERPFATLSFMALTPIPELKLTDLGLFDSQNFKFVSVHADENM